MQGKYDSDKIHPVIKQICGSVGAIWKQMAKIKNVELKRLNVQSRNQ